MIVSSPGTPRRPQIPGIVEGAILWVIRDNSASAYPPPSLTNSMIIR